MRKILNFILVLALLLSLMIPAAAAEGAKVQVTYPTGTAVGGTFTVTVDCTENPGISGAEMALAYDPAVVQCTSVDTGKVLSGMMNATNPAASDGARLAAISLDATSATGTLCTFTFKVVAEGDYGFALNDLLLIDYDNEAVPVTVTGVDFTLLEDGPAEPETPGKPEQPAGSGITDTTYTDTVDHWAAAEIEEATDTGLVNGMGNELYAPDAFMTRGQFVTILWRYSGSPEPKGTSTFIDLEPNMVYYHKAVVWAEENGVMNGVGNFKFDPKGNVTREQIATTLFRMAGSKSGGELMFTGIYNDAFADSGKVSAWAKDAVYWAIYQGIWCDVDSLSMGNALFPQVFADRAQIAVMMTRYQELFKEGE